MKTNRSKLFAMNDGIERNECNNRYWVEYLFGFVAALPMLIAGTQLTWFGPAILILQNEVLSPIGVVSNVEASWINSLLYAGSLPGAIFGAYLANTIGRKYSLIITIIPTGLSSLLIIFMKNVYMVYMARVLAGLTTGITMVALPTYLTEISSPKVRGILGTFTVIFMSSSFVIMYFIQPIMTLKSISIIVFAFSFVQCCMSLYFLPETPNYYIMKGKDELAKNSLQTLRQSMSVEKELLHIKECRVLEEQNKISFCNYLQTKMIRKSLSILLITIIGQQCSGPFIVLSYLPTVLNESIPKISTYFGSIVLIICFVIGTCLSTLFIDNFGRRFLFINSGILIGLFTSLISLYYVCEFKYGIEKVSKYSVILFILFFWYFIIFAFGQMSMVNIYVGELFETHFRATAGLIASAANSFCGFILIQIYGIIYRNCGLQYLYLIFTVCCILYTFFAYFFLPETKGKSLQEVQREI